MEKAKEIARHLGIADFQGSRGWLEKWKQRFNIKQMRVCGESGDVRGKTIESWKERLPEILEGYGAEDVWNMDESGIFWKALPDYGFGRKGSQCKGGKKQAACHCCVVRFSSWQEGEAFYLAIRESTLLALL